MAYLQPNSMAPTADSAGMEPIERERRKNAVQKFLARAENSMVRVLTIPLFGVNVRVLAGNGADVSGFHMTFTICPSLSTSVILLFHTRHLLNPFGANLVVIR